MYKKNPEGIFEAISYGDDFKSPVSTTHDGKQGDTKVVNLFIRNDNSSTWYSNIIIYPKDLEQPNGYDDVSYNDTGWGVKLIVGSNQPTPSEWNDTDWGNSISMEDIGSDISGDTTTYQPFWYLITCPPNEDAKNKSDIVLRVEYTENSVI